MVKGSVVILKYLLFGFNFILWISGVGLISAGAVVQIQYRNYISFLGDDVFNLPILLIIVGCVIAVIGFFGCCGAIRENYCMVVTFSILIIACLIVELGIGIASYFLRNDLEEIITKKAKHGLLHFNHAGYAGVTMGWIRLQQDFECCGVTGFRDWNATDDFKESAGAVPPSCCRNATTDTCGNGVRLETDDAAAKTVHTGGCLEQLLEWVKRNVAAVSQIAVVIAVIQILGVIFSCCFAHKLHGEYKEV